MRSSLSELRSDIQRGEDKHMGNVMEIHDKEVDRMMRLLENLSVKAPGDAATPAPQKQTTVDPWVAAQLQQLQTVQQQMASLLTAPIVAPASSPAAPLTLPRSAAVTPVTPVIPTARPTVPVVPSPAQLKFGPATPVTERTQAPAVTTHDEEEEGGEHPEAYEPEADFAPVIPLPELVKVVTGEENEKILFETRCKVYRYMDKEWKERGTGDLKVLENPETARQRIVMRRDQVFKVCVNHGFDASMKIEKMAKNAKAVTWVCMDASDGEPAMTQLSARFASEELATDFKKTFEKCVDNAKNSIKAEVKKEEVKSQGDRGTGFDWKEPEGSWNCQGCYANNPAKDSKCQCCGTGKDGSPAETITQVISKPMAATTAQTSSPFSFGLNKADPSIGNLSLSSREAEATKDEKPVLSFGQKPEAAKPETPTMTFSFNKPVVPATTAAVTPTGNKFSFADAAKLAANDDTKKPIAFSFGQKSQLAQSPLASATAANPPTTTPTFSFKPAAASTGQKPLFGGSASTASPAGSLFGGGTSSATASPSQTAATDSKPAEQKNVFGSMFGNNSGSNAFGFSTPKTSIFEGQSAQNAKNALSALKKAQPLGAKPTNGDDESKGADEEYEPDFDFKPVIPLPDLVEIKTGEEGEEIIFKERCKLYRYNKETRETAERGTGDMKVLKNPETGLLRCVMRREQVHTLCANFRIIHPFSINEKPNTPNVAVFNCKDFSEKPEGDDETFFVRFKTPEQCQTFINTFRSGVAAAN
ncbi:unnamed protein product, partial [Mesorhabditis belari]|uniref:Uncharacterized protein n=1 Tax=Mesorhabditis belari TaxID=2138241 RepID=A0AAF3EYD8_9BILA